MRAEAVRADRYRDVRQAARAWRSAGAIDEPTLAAVEAAYPDDRKRLGPSLRALTFLFTAVGLAALGFFVGGRLTDWSGDGGPPFALVYGLALVGLTELQLGALRRSEGGTETATALVGLGYLLVGILWTLERAGVHGDAVAWSLGVVVFLAAAWRWGMELGAVAAAVCFFALLSRFDHARLLFALFAPLLLVATLAAEVSPRLAPSHRRGAVGVQAVAVVALYVALHLGSWDARLLEGRHAYGPGLARWLFTVATALLPLVLIAAGVRGRRRPLLGLGLLALVASLITVRFYVHLAPLWVVLILGGALALSVALVLERWVGAGRDRQRGGFTADPLFDDERRLRALEVAVAATQAGPAARTVPAADFRGGGGQFGGGGATGSY